MKRQIQIWWTAFLLALSVLFLGGGAWGAVPGCAQTGMIKTPVSIVGSVDGLRR